jgi:hypothetical protein
MNDVSIQDMPRYWQRSSRCVAEAHCAEVAIQGPWVYLRNSTRPRILLRLTRDQWSDLLETLRSDAALRRSDHRARSRTRSD